MSRASQGPLFDRAIDMADDEKKSPGGRPILVISIAESILIGMNEG